MVIDDSDPLRPFTAVLFCMVDDYPVDEGSDDLRVEVVDLCEPSDEGEKSLAPLYTAFCIVHELVDVLGALLQGYLFIVISDNRARPPLRNTEYADFQRENPGRSIDFITTANKAHDRYIILDYNTKDMKVYHCGASSKDAGKKITSIMQVKDISNYSDMVKELLANPPLVLR